MACKGCNGLAPVVEYHTNGMVIDRTNPCEAVTVDTLEIYKWSVDCLITSGLYDRATSNEAEAKAGREILINWIADKQQDYKSCTYQHYLPVMQDLVKRIMASGLCR